MLGCWCFKVCFLVVKDVQSFRKLSALAFWLLCLHCFQSRQIRFLGVPRFWHLRFVGNSLG